MIAKLAAYFFVVLLSGGAIGIVSYFLGLKANKRPIAYIFATWPWYIACTYLAWYFILR